MVNIRDIRQRGFVHKSNNQQNNNKNDNQNKNKQNFAVVCPWCERPTIILSVNCGIFRHGVCKKKMIQIPPHASKNVCDKLVKEDKIYGCGKPFQVKNDGTTSKCDYI